MEVIFMWDRQDFDEKPVKAHFFCEREEWEALDYNINTSKSRFLRDCIHNINARETELDKLYKQMVVKRNELRLLEMEIDLMQERIAELEKMNAKKEY